VGLRVHLWAAFAEYLCARFRVHLGGIFEWSRQIGLRISRERASTNHFKYRLFNAGLTQIMIGPADKQVAEPIFEIEAPLLRGTSYPLLRGRSPIPSRQKVLGILGTHSFRP
jgi:hypothetical protein